MKPRRMLLILCVLLLSLTACAVQPEVSAEIEPMEVSTKTPILPTATKVATATSSPVPTETIEPQPENIATPLPTQPSYVITPNPAQVMNWEEYEDALSHELLDFRDDNAAGDEFICEWILLGDEPGKLYAWVRCYGYFLSEEVDIHSDHDTPAVILIDENDNIVKVLIPWSVSTSYAEGVSILFPEELQSVIFGHRLDTGRLGEHLDYRLDHPDELPLIVLDATATNIAELTPTPQPTAEERYPDSPAISEKVQEEIKQVIEAYIDLRYQSYNTLEVQDFASLTSDSEIAQESLEQEILKVTYEVKHKELNNNRYADYLVSLSYLSFIPGTLTDELDFTPLKTDVIEEIVLDNSSFDEEESLVVQVLLQESSEYTYQDDVDVNPETPLVAKVSGIEHIVILEKNAEGWKIVSDYYMDDLWRMLRESGTTPQELLDELEEE